MLTDDVEAFEIYRPPRIPSRLEPKFIPPPENEWRPSLDYKHTLLDVKQQFTPAEYYRQRLKTSGAYIRMIQRLEMRWSRHLEKFTSASITVQAWFRGVMGRRLFQKVKIANYDTMLRRKFTPPAMSAYAQGDYHSALTEIFKAPAPHGDVLWTLTAKCQYRLKKYHDCIATCLVLRGEIMCSISLSVFSTYYVIITLYCRGSSSKCRFLSPSYLRSETDSQTTSRSNQ